jgi:hypothetical protein
MKKSLYVLATAVLTVASGCVKKGSVTETCSTDSDIALVSQIRNELPSGWVCTVVNQDGQKGHPHGLDEPLFRADFTNPQQVFEAPKGKNRAIKLNPLIQLYFYDIHSKAHTIKVIREESRYSWNIPIYFGETDKYIVVTSPSYVNHGVFTEDAKKTIWETWKVLRKHIVNKEDKTIEELAEPDK